MWSVRARPNPAGPNPGPRDESKQLEIVRTDSRVVSISSQFKPWIKINIFFSFCPLAYKTEEIEGDPLLAENLLRPSPHFPALTLSMFLTNIFLVHFVAAKLKNMPVWIYEAGFSLWINFKVNLERNWTRYKILHWEITKWNSNITKLTTKLRSWVTHEPQDVISTVISTPFNIDWASPNLRYRRSEVRRGCWAPWYCRWQVSTHLNLNCWPSCSPGFPIKKLMLL